MMASNPFPKFEYTKSSSAIADLLASALDLDLDSMSLGNGAGLMKKGRP